MWWRWLVAGLAGAWAVTGCSDESVNTPDSTYAYAIEQLREMQGRNTEPRVADRIEEAISRLTDEVTDPEPWLIDAIVVGDGAESVILLQFISEELIGGSEIRFRRALRWELLMKPTYPRKPPHSPLMSVVYLRKEWDNESGVSPDHQLDGDQILIRVGEYTSNEVEIRRLEKKGGEADRSTGNIESRSGRKRGSLFPIKPPLFLPDLGR